MNYSEKIKTVFNAFDGKDLERLNDFYAQDVVFEDPVDKISGLPALKKYYTHAYKNVISIRFDFADIINQDNAYAAPWTMHMKVRGLNGGEEYAVKGLSQMVFNDKGLVVYHRDYVDLGAMVYERLPLFGAVIRKLKKLLAP